MTTPEGEETNIINQVKNKLGFVPEKLFLKFHMDGCDNEGPESWVIELMMKNGKVLVKYDLYLDINGNLSGFDTKKKTKQKIGFNTKKKNKQKKKGFKPKKKIKQKQVGFKRIHLEDLFDMFSIENIEDF